MRFYLSIVCLFSVSLVPVGCDREHPAKPATQPTPATASAAIIGETGLAIPEEKKSAPPSPAAPVVYTEDLDIDPVRDPIVRAKSKELKAITINDLKTLKPGDEAYVLVRGDKGGGTIYGSGPYTLDSQLRKAVVHNGALKHNELGIVKLKVLKNENEHPSVPANGITPTAWGKYHASYTIEKVED